MATYILYYNLNRDSIQADDYLRVHAALRETTDSFRSLYSFWIVETKLSPKNLINRLIDEGAIEDRDSIVVLQITGIGDFLGVREPDQVWLEESLTRC